MRNVIRSLCGFFVFGSICLAETATPTVDLPLERTAYFAGEKVPLAIAGVAADAVIKLEAVNADGSFVLYEGKPQPLLLNPVLLAPGDSQLRINGAPALGRLTSPAIERVSPGSLQDEAAPQLP